MNPKLTDMSSDSNDSLSRRDVIRYGGYVGIAGMGGLAGCSGGGGDGQSGDGAGGESGETTQSTSTDTQASGESEDGFPLIHHWSRGADGEAMAAFLDGFTNKYDVTINELTPSGQAGKNVRTIVRKRLLNDNPPGSWQGLGGADQSEFAQDLKDIGSEVWEAEGAKEAYYPGAEEAGKLEGSYKTVPTNLHRTNVLFYNKQVLSDADVDPSSITGLQSLSDALDAINQNTEAAPFAKSTSEPWTMLSLWESLFLSVAGVEKFRQFADGEVSAVESEVREALNLLKEYMPYFPDDANSIAWPEAASKVGQGDAAFYQVGDFAVGVLLGIDGFEFKTDWEWMAVPGTEDYFLNVLDTFCWPKNSPTPEASKEFCRWCASVEGQEILNSIKGSIPPRGDVPRDEFGGYQTDQMDAIEQTEAQPLTMTFTGSVPPEVSSSMKETIGTFVANTNVDSAYQGFSNAF
jgi:glucose/mannose transport system substrate-binding protein